MVKSEEILRSWEELPWTDYQEGLRSCVLEVDAEQLPAGPCIVALDYSPHLKLPPHFHNWGHLEIILSGALYIGGRLETAGMIRSVPARIKYGPLETREEGARVIEVFTAMTADAAGGQYEDADLELYGLKLDEIVAKRARTGVTT